MNTTISCRLIDGSEYQWKINANSEKNAVEYFFHLYRDVSEMETAKINNKVIVKNGMKV